MTEGLPQGVLLNVNIPQKWTGKVHFTRQSSKITRNVLQPGTDPRGRKYFWLHEQQLVDAIEPDTDLAAVRDGAISITPLELITPTPNRSSTLALVQASGVRRPQVISAAWF